MADGLDTIYDALLLQHIRQAPHYGLQAPGASVDEDVAALSGCTIHNPLCGDSLQLQLHWQASRLASLRFECECCGIAMGNASLMTLMLAGQDGPGAIRLVQTALAVLRGAAVPDDAVDHVAAPWREEAAAGWSLLAEIGQRLPARRTCASLGWQAVAAALEGSSEATAQEVR